MAQNKKRNSLYIASGIAALIAVALLINFALKRPSGEGIPEISDPTLLSTLVAEQIEDALEKAKRKPSADNLGALGMVYHSSAFYEEAAACYLLAIEKEEEAWIWSYYLGHLSIEMGESTAVTDNFSRVIEIMPEALHAWYYSGLEYKNRREYEKAEECFGMITGIDTQETTGNKSFRFDQFPLGTYAKFQLARSYFDKGQMDLAETLLQEIIEFNHMYGPAYRLLGNIYSTQGNDDLSSRYAVRANDLRTFSPPVDTLIDKLALLSKSELYLLKKIDEAVNSIHPRWALKLIQNGVRYFPGNRDLVSKAVSVNLWVNNIDQAYAYTDQHMALFMENFEEMQHTGMLYFQKDLYPPAVQYLSAALDINSVDLETQLNLAISLWRTGEQQLSYELLQQIISAHPDDLELLARVADLMFFDLGQAEMAKDYLLVLDHYLPSNPKVQKMSAWMAEINGKTREAVRLYEASFKGDPQDFTCIKNLGTLLTREKMWDKAIQHYRKALESHPNEQYFLERLGTLLVTCPDKAFIDTEEGKEYSERAFFHYRGQSGITVYAGRSLAIANSMLGDKATAQRIINMTISLARSENFSAENMKVLEDFARQLAAG